MASSGCCAQRRSVRLLIVLGLGLAGSRVAQSFPLPSPAPSPCAPTGLANIPVRPADAPTGSQFARTVQSLAGPERDQRITAQLLAGDIPNFLRHLSPVTVHSTAPQHPVAITVCVLPDYLAVGSDRDFLFVPVGLKAAVTIADRLGFVLPTPKLVDAIYDASQVKLHPQPLPAGDEMRSTAYLLLHTNLIRQQLFGQAAELGALTSGDKKDLVLTTRLWEIPGRVAIYGWHRASSEPIQPLSTVHGARYADYSHGVRLVSQTVYVDGTPRPIHSVLADRDLAPVLTSEGPLGHLRERLAGLERQ